MHELNIAAHTAVDWDSFCRETCEVTLMEREHPIGGPGKIVQIDESKFGKRKYHRGHRVEGQWVFGGIEEESRRSFMVAVEKRDESTLLPIIERHIAKCSIIVSDCWKAYINLEKHGYEHRLVNHSKEFVNNDGDHTNKIEGHWRQAKCKMPSFGVRKIAFSSYLAEFLWRYEHKGKDLFSMFLWDVKKFIVNFEVL
jgi:transposase-like protein